MNKIAGSRIREWSGWILLLVLILLAGFGSGFERALCIVAAAVLVLLKSDLYCLEGAIAVLRRNLNLLEKRFSHEQESVEIRLKSLAERVEELAGLVSLEAPAQPIVQQSRGSKRLWLAGLASLLVALNFAVFGYLQAEIRFLRSVADRATTQQELHSSDGVALSSKEIAIDSLDQLAYHFSRQDRAVFLRNDSFAVTEH